MIVKTSLVQRDTLKFPCEMPQNLGLKWSLSRHMYTPGEKKVVAVRKFYIPSSTVQRRFRAHLRKLALSSRTRPESLMRRDWSRSGHPETLRKAIKQVRGAFKMPPEKSLCRASAKVALTSTSIWNALLKHMMLLALEIQLVSARGS